MYGEWVCMNSDKVMEQGRPMLETDGNGRHWPSKDSFQIRDYNFTLPEMDNFK